MVLNAQGHLMKKKVTTSTLCTVPPTYTDCCSSVYKKQQSNIARIEFRILPVKAPSPVK